MVLFHHLLMVRGLSLKVLMFLPEHWRFEGVLPREEKVAPGKDPYKLVCGEKKTS